tara:strand:+ start:5864 stop:7447 length:1584 start_codon:yes stop_codon:yes gene_type:complete
MKVNILDCTLRDGGYYNSWKFEKNTVSKYIKALSLSSVSHIEIGFRFLPNSLELGEFAYSSEELLNSIDFPRNKKIGVMINGSEYLKESNPKKAIKENFIKSKKSKISFVRIAIDALKATNTKVLVEELNNLGYSVILNLMQANLRAPYEINHVAEEIQQWNMVDVVYFADSLGSMNPKTVRSFHRSLAKSWKGHIGFHAHNNQNLALANAISSINSGCNFCDSTILGMGRGAGNTQTENLLAQSNGYYDSKSMLEALAHFSKLKKKYDWGPNIFYQIASEDNIHPTYVQTMLADKRYTNEQVLRALDVMKNIESTSFDEKNITKLTYFKNTDHQGKWNGKDFMSGRAVLLVGAGPNLKKHKAKVQEFIRNAKPFVLSLNVNQILDNEMIDAVIASNIDRVLLDADLYSHFKCPIILPQSCFSPIIKDYLRHNKILDYGMAIKPESFKSFKTGCISQWKEVLAYSLLFLEQASPESLYLAGFDGYPVTDSKYHENNKIFEKYFSMKNSLKPTLLTPSTQSALNRFEK